MKNFFRRFSTRLWIWYHQLRPVYALMTGYAVYVLIAFVLLSLPICWEVSDVPLIDTLFTAVATVSTSGLQTVNFAETYNILGQIVVLIGIQISGLGYMTLGSLFVFASTRHLSRNRIKIGQAVLAMPESFEPLRFLRHIAIFTLSIELIGALILWICFSAAGVPNPLWAAVFHSVAAFCTAGISIFPSNLEAFADNAPVTLTMSLLCLLGGIGFIVMEDVYQSIKHKTVQITLTTKVILVATFGAVLLGTLFLFCDPNLTEFSLKQRFLMAFFQTVSALTTSGFNTMPVSNLASATLVIVIVLMLLGPSPSGTGGGLKNTTWATAIAALLSFFRSRQEITFFNYTVPHYRTTTAFAAITLYVMTFVIGTYCLLLCNSHPFEQVVFESASALGTVGLSHGITSELCTMGKVIIMVLMYIGRLGILSLALGAIALYHDISHDKGIHHVEDEPPIKEDDIML